MTALERLMAEELPTGTFGDSRPTTPRPSACRPKRPRTPDPLAGQHRADLEAALDGWAYRPHRHLQPVPGTGTAPNSRAA